MHLTLSSDELRPLVSEVVTEVLRQVSEQVVAKQLASDDRLLVDATQAAEMLSVCAKTLWTLTDAGHIPVVRIGRSVRYDPCDLRRWVQNSKTTAGHGSPDLQRLQALARSAPGDMQNRIDDNKSQGGGT